MLSSLTNRGENNKFVFWNADIYILQIMDTCTVDFDVLHFAPQMLVSYLLKECSSTYWISRILLFYSLTSFVLVLIPRIVYQGLSS